MKYGKIVDLNIVRDPFTKESRGFGFITYDNSKSATESIEALNKTELDGRNIIVEFSKRTRPHKPTPGVYLGPAIASSRRRSSSREGKYSRRNRSRSRSRSRSHSKGYKKRRPAYSRSKSRSHSQRKK